MGQDDRVTHEHIPSIDLHADTLMAIVHDGHDLAGPGVQGSELDVPRMRAGRLDAQVFSIFVTPYWSGEAAAERAHYLIDRLKAQLARPDLVGQITPVVSAAELEVAVAKGQRCALLGIEGGHALANSLERLHEFALRGVRYVTLTWSNANDWADSSGSPSVHGGLTDLGRRIVREMERLGVLVDLSHVADSTFWNAIDVTSAPVIASHSSCRALCAHPRNLTDDQLRAIAASGGIVGINFHSAFLDAACEPASWTAPWRAGGTFSDPAAAELADRRGRPPQVALRTTIDRLADHVVHALAVAGPDHVGLGSDFDGKIASPVGLEDVARLPNLRDALARRGVAPSVLAAVWGGNVLRVFAEADRRRVIAGL